MDKVFNKLHSLITHILCKTFFIKFDFFFFVILNKGYPVSVSGMITLPVSSSVYQSMVANIQQIHTNSDGTLCITPMQVQKRGHQLNVDQIDNVTNISSNANNSTCSDSLNNSFSSTSSQSSTMVANCHQNSNNEYASSHMQSFLSCDNQTNGSNNLLELCRVLSQTGHTTEMQNSSNGFSIPVSVNNPQWNSVAVNEKKIIKSRKLVSRNQFNLNVTNFDSNQSCNKEQIAHSNRHQYTEQQAARCHKDGNDTNNNNEDDNIKDIDSDLKCHMITSTILGESQKMNNSSNNFISIEIDDDESRIIKTEIDAA